MDLTGKLLVAMPGMLDPRFDHAVILICSHGADGAMGLIVNKPLQDMQFSQVLDHMGIAHDPNAIDVRCLFGGPVERGRGFVLHGNVGGGEGKLRVSEDFSLTTTRDILVDLAKGKGPGRAMLALGYSGWGPGQLESEITRNDWLSVDADADLVFSGDAAAKWSGALAVLGIDALTLSARAGHA